MISDKLSWPEMPYKGLSFYGPDDILLFAGRDHEIIECARSLSKENLRILILQGETGCGKSSFLRAGLIPHLEHRGIGYHFIRELRGKSNKALFIRSTDKPIFTIAEAVFNYARSPLEVNTPLGIEYISLSDAIQNCSDVGEFQELVSKDYKKLLDAIKHISSKVPDTLVFVLDQGEEVLTLAQAESGNGARDDFFDFLALLDSTTIDIKLVIAIRTEYYGRFDEQLIRRTGGTRFSSYMLHEMSQAGLVAAITRPTLRHAVHGFEQVGDSPYTFYKFDYEDGVAEKIAEDLIGSPTKGGILPVLQIVCERLYKSTKRERVELGCWSIKLEDYTKLGGLEGPIRDYVSGILFRKCMDSEEDKKFLKVSSKEMFDVIVEESNNWEDVLMILVRTHADGTVTTDLRPVDELREKALDLGCRINFDEMMDYLSDDNQRLLRPPITVLQKGTNKEIKCYSLGHDAVGLMLSVSANSRAAQAQFAEKVGAQIIRSRKIKGCLHILHSIILFVFLVSSEFGFFGISSSKGLQVIVAIAAPSILLFGIISVFRKKRLTERQVFSIMRIRFESRYARNNLFKRVYFLMKRALSFY